MYPPVFCDCYTTHKPRLVTDGSLRLSPILTLYNGWQQFVLPPVFRDLCTVEECMPRGSQSQEAKGRNKSSPPCLNAHPKPRIKSYISVFCDLLHNMLRHLTNDRTLQVFCDLYTMHNPVRSVCVCVCVHIHYIQHNSGMRLLLGRNCGGTKLRTTLRVRLPSSQSPPLEHSVAAWSNKSVSRYKTKLC